MPNIFHLKVILIMRLWSNNHAVLHVSPMATNVFYCAEVVPNSLQSSGSNANLDAGVSTPQHYTNLIQVIINVL